MTVFLCSFVNTLHADETLKRTACSGHIECSALTQSNLRPVFDSAIQSAIGGIERKNNQKSRLVSILFHCFY